MDSKLLPKKQSRSRHNWSGCSRAGSRTKTSSRRQRCRAHCGATKPTAFWLHPFEYSKVWARFFGDWLGLSQGALVSSVRTKPCHVLKSSKVTDSHCVRVKFWTSVMGTPEVFHAEVRDGSALMSQSRGCPSSGSRIYVQIPGMWRGHITQLVLGFGVCRGRGSRLLKV